MDSTVPLFREEPTTNEVLHPRPNLTSYFCARVAPTVSSDPPTPLVCRRAPRGVGLLESDERKERG